MSDVERKRKWIINALYYALLGVLFFLAVRYAVGVAFPIIFAFVLAALLQKPKNFIMKKTPLKKGTASAICVFGLILVIAAIISLIGVRAVNEIKGFIEYLTVQFENIDSVVNTLENSIIGFIGKLPEFISDTLKENITALFTQLREYIAGTSSELPEKVTSGLSGFSFSWIKTPISGVISTAKQIPSVLIAVVISIVCTCFLTADFDTVKNFIRCQFPAERQKDLSRARTLLRTSLGKMGKAYLLIMLITFAELFLGLSVLKLLGIYQMGYIVIVSIVTAIIDIVPVLGTGTVLIPWALYSLIVGDFGMAIGLVVIYAVITVIRQIIEPKLVAGQLGLPPFVTLIAMYFGLKIFGFLGIFILPLVIIMLKLLNDEGIIKLWKSPSAVSAQPEKESTEKPESDTEK